MRVLIGKKFQFLVLLSVAVSTVGCKGEDDICLLGVAVPRLDITVYDSASGNVLCDTDLNNMNPFGQSEWYRGSCRYTFDDNHDESSLFVATETDITVELEGYEDHIERNVKYPEEGCHVARGESTEVNIYLDRI